VLNRTICLNYQSIISISLQDRSTTVKVNGDMRNDTRKSETKEILQMKAVHKIVWEVVILA